MSVQPKPDMTNLCALIAAGDRNSKLTKPGGGNERYRAIADAVLAGGFTQPRVCTALHELCNATAGSILRTAAGRVITYDQGAHLNRCPSCSGRHLPDCLWFSSADLPVTVIWEMP